MANLPESIWGDSPSVAGPNKSTAANAERLAALEQWIKALQSHETRERALIVLSKVRENREDLAPLLWDSFGTVTLLLQEIISVYVLLSSSNLTERVSNRVSNALALFQCIASHPDTRKKFLKAQLPQYLYPFLNIKNKEKAYEYLRLASLGVIGALVKSNDPEAVLFLLDTQAFPSCLVSMEVGTELSKTVATFIVHKILLDDEGLKYCCTFAERFFAVARLLRQMIEKFAEEPSKRLLKLIIGCYLRLSENPRACDGLRCCFPLSLTDSTFFGLLQGDPNTMECLRKLINNVSVRQRPVALEESHVRIRG
ncbi:cell differentiation protein rcd1-like [Mangifera indica]|uniref:cell differentiation protein rcd1-like n=1 Tax=Mangifera indica TaxID=29780 RepID=UPI001CFB5635|nr:cell differentiation protein rcd1-like [Mangifera indica]